MAKRPALSDWLMDEEDVDKSIQSLLSCIPETCGSAKVIGPSDRIENHMTFFLCTASSSSLRGAYLSTHSCLLPSASAQGRQGWLELDGHDLDMIAKCISICSHKLATCLQIHSAQLNTKRKRIFWIPSKHCYFK